MLLGDFLVCLCKSGRKKGRIKRRKVSRSEGRRPSVHNASHDVEQQVAGTKHRRTKDGGKAILLGAGGTAAAATDVVCISKIGAEDKGDGFHDIVGHLGEAATQHHDSGGHGGDENEGGTVHHGAAVIGGHGGDGGS